MAQIINKMANALVTLLGLALTLALVLGSVVEKVMEDVWMWEPAGKAIQSVPMSDENIKALQRDVPDALRHKMSGMSAGEKLAYLAAFTQRLLKDGFAELISATMELAKSVSADSFQLLQIVRAAGGVLDGDNLGLSLAGKTLGEVSVADLLYHVACGATSQELFLLEFRNWLLGTLDLEHFGAVRAFVAALVQHDGELVRRMLDLVGDADVVLRGFEADPQHLAPMQAAFGRHPDFFASLIAAGRGREHDWELREAVLAVLRRAAGGKAASFELSAQVPSGDLQACIRRLFAAKAPTADMLGDVMAVLKHEPTRQKFANAVIVVLPLELASLELLVSGGILGAPTSADSAAAKAMTGRGALDAHGEAIMRLCVATATVAPRFSDLLEDVVLDRVHQPVRWLTAIKDESKVAARLRRIFHVSEALWALNDHVPVPLREKHAAGMQRFKRAFPSLKGLFADREVDGMEALMLGLFLDVAPQAAIIARMQQEAQVPADFTAFDFNTVLGDELMGVHKQVDSGGELLAKADKESSAFSETIVKAFLVSALNAYDGEKPGMGRVIYALSSIALSDIYLWDQRAWETMFKEAPLQSPFFTSYNSKSHAMLLRVNRTALNEYLVTIVTSEDTAKVHPRRGGKFVPLYEITPMTRTQLDAVSFFRRLNVSYAGMYRGASGTLFPRRVVDYPDTQYVEGQKGGTCTATRIWYAIRHAMGLTSLQVSRIETALMLSFVQTFFPLLARDSDESRRRLAIILSSETLAYTAILAFQRPDLKAFIVKQLESTVQKLQVLTQDSEVLEPVWIEVWAGSQDVLKRLNVDLKPAKEDEAPAKEDEAPAPESELTVHGASLQLEEE